jgi:hypothetical protein
VIDRRAAAPLLAAVLLIAACGERAATQAGESILVTKGCNQCHAVEKLGIAAQAAIGPDLSDAASAVPTRYGRDLRGFFDHPSGTMQLVLSSQIELTPQERDSIIRVLETIDAR